MFSDNAESSSVNWNKYMVELYRFLKSNGVIKQRPVPTSTGPSSSIHDISPSHVDEEPRGSISSSPPLPGEAISPSPTPLGGEGWIQWGAKQFMGHFQ